MDISSLHKSISEFSENELRTHIRNIRELRRQFPDVKVRTVKKGKKKSKNTKKVTIKPDITKLSQNEKQILLQKLLKIKEKKNGKK